MNEIICDGTVQPIGYQRENNRSRVPIPLEEIADAIREYPGGSFTLGYKRPGDRCFNISENFVVDEEEMVLIWTVENAALSLKGVLEVQISYASGSVLAETDIFKYRVKKSIFDGKEMPLSFIDHISRAIMELDRTARVAEGYADGTEHGIPVGPDHPRYEDNARFYYLMAKAIVNDLGLCIVDGKLCQTYEKEEEAS